MKANIILTIAFFISCCVIACQQKMKDMPDTMHGYSHASTDHTDVYGDAKFTDEELQTVADDFEKQIVQLGEELGHVVTAEYHQDAQYYVVWVFTGPGQDAAPLEIEHRDFETIREFVKTAPLHLLK